MSINNEIVIQLGKFNETVKKNDTGLNSEWTNHCKQSVTINQGDQVMVSKSYIDTRNLSSSNIVIDTDTELSLEMWYYWINDGNPGSQQSAFVSAVNPAPTSDPNNPNLNGTGAWYKPYDDIFENLFYMSPEYSVVASLQSSSLLQFQSSIFPNSSTYTYNNLTNGAQINAYADGRPYLLCNSNNTPFTQTWTYTLKAGTYSPAGLANLLTIAMAEVKKNNAVALNNNQAVEWFNPNPINPNNIANPPPPQVLDQPFIVQTNASPPLYAIISRQTDPGTNQSGELSIFQMQPNIHIHPNQGIPVWNGGQSYSLCFKNIISDCPVDTAQMFPSATTIDNNGNPQANPNNIPTGGEIYATQMIPGLTYIIIGLGLTNWYRCGDYFGYTPPPPPQPAIGDIFWCIVPDNRGQSNLPVQDIIVSDQYTISNQGTTINVTAQQNIPAFQCIVGNTYTISSLGDTDWNALGYVGTPTVGQSFVCTSQEIIPNPGSFKPTSYINIVSGQEYQVVSLGLPYYGNFLYDTDWKSIFDIVSYPVINQIYTSTITGMQSNIEVNKLPDIITTITFTITSTTDDINWGALGWTADPNNNNTNPIISLLNNDSLPYSGMYQVISLGQLLGTIDGIIIYDVDWETFTEQDNYLGISIGERVNIYDSGITVVISLDLLNQIPNDTGITVVNPGTTDWTLYGQVYAPDPTTGYFNVYIENNPGNNTDTTFIAWSIPTGSIQLVNSYQSLLPFTFTATANGVNPTYFQNIPNYQGYVDGTGIVDYVFYDGTCIDTAPINILTDTDWGHVGASIPGNETNPFTCIATYQPWSFQNYFYIFAIDVFYTILNADSNIDWSIFSQSLPPKPWTYPFTFKVTEQPDTSQLTGRFSAIINATGKLETEPGTVQEIIGQNFYLYPLTIAASPYMNNKQQGNSDVSGPMYSYQFPIVGSTEISIQYNADTNRFEWLYIDTPIMQQDQPSSGSGINSSTYIERVGIINTFNKVPFTANELAAPNIPIYSSSYQYKSSTCKLVSKSGCMFRKMEPASFWQGIMGFSPDLVVSDKELGLSSPSSPALDPLTPLTTNRFTYKRFNEVTTRGLLTTAMNFTNLGLGVGNMPNLPHINAEPSYISGYPVNLLNNTVLTQWYQYEMATSLFAFLNLGTNDPNGGAPNILNNFFPDPFYPLNTQYSNPPSFNSQWYDALDQRCIISSTNAPLLISDETGHYLLDIEGYSGGGLLNEQQKYNIKSIVSSYYVNAGTFTSGVFPDPQIYTHVGEPLVLQNFKVRILNPITMKPIGGLGANSCVYLQINKNYSDIQQKQNESS